MFSSNTPQISAALTKFVSTASLLFHANPELYVSPHFVFCLMKTKEVSNEVCERFSSKSYLRQNLKSDCMSFMNKEWVPSSVEECTLFLDEYDISEDEQSQMISKWDQFLIYANEYKKTYQHMDDMKHRFSLFHDNIQYIIQHNEGNHSYQLGVNQFADWSNQEFKQYVMDGSLGGVLKTTCPKAKDMSGSYPTSVDWRTKGIVRSAPSDQGSCGSCYTFSTTASVEGAYAQKTGTFVKLSEQSLVDCGSGLTYGSHGCSGGLMDGMFNYIHDKGIPSADSYAYTAKEGSCHSYTPITYVSGCEDVPANELQLTYALTQRVVSIAIQADGRSFQLYKSGVFDDSTCYQGSLDHGVSLVGYGHDSSSNKDYYVLMNSWGTSWGMNGFMNIKRNSVTSSTTGMCGLAMMNSYPLM